MAPSPDREDPTVALLEAAIAAGARLLARLRDAEARVYEMENRGTCGACGAEHVILTPHDGLLRCWPCRKEWEGRKKPDDNSRDGFTCVRCGEQDWKKVSWCGQYFCPGCRPSGTAPKQVGEWSYSDVAGEWECVCPVERVQKPTVKQCRVCTALRPPVADRDDRVSP